MQDFKPGRYQHFKGGLYAGFCLVKNGYNPEKNLVLYMPLYNTNDNDGARLFARPLENFLETIVKDNQKVQRFTRVDELLPEDLNYLSKELLKIED